MPPDVDEPPEAVPVDEVPPDPEELPDGEDELAGAVGCTPDTDVSGYSLVVPLAPATISCGTEPAATPEVSMPVTVPVAVDALAPVPVGTETWRPKSRSCAATSPGSAEELGHLLEGGELRQLRHRLRGIHGLQGILVATSSELSSCMNSVRLTVCGAGVVAAAVGVVWLPVGEVTAETDMGCGVRRRCAGEAPSTGSAQPPGPPRPARPGARPRIAAAGGCRRRIPAGRRTRAGRTRGRRGRRRWWRRQESPLEEKTGGANGVARPAALGAIACHWLARAARIAATKASLESTIAKLQTTIGDLGQQSGLIANTRSDLEALKHKGDRQYYEFTLEKGAKAQAISTVKLQLKRDGSQARQVFDRCNRR